MSTVLDVWPLIDPEVAQALLALDLPGMIEPAEGPRAARCQALRCTRGLARWSAVGRPL
jgi:hypothetical protein